MKYNVIRPFRNVDGKFLRINDTVDCDVYQARPLIRNRMIGNYQEKAVESTGEIPEVNITEKTIEFKPKRKYRKRKNV